MRNGTDGTDRTDPTDRTDRQRPASETLAATRGCHPQRLPLRAHLRGRAWGRRHPQAKTLEGGTREVDPEWWEGPGAARFAKPSTLDQVTCAVDPEWEKPPPVRPVGQSTHSGSSVGRAELIQSGWTGPGSRRKAIKPIWIKLEGGARLIQSGWIGLGSPREASRGCRRLPRSVSLRGGLCVTIPGPTGGGISVCRGASCSGTARVPGASDDTAWSAGSQIPFGGQDDAWNGWAAVGRPAARGSRGKACGRQPQSSWPSISAAQAIRG